MYRFFFEGQALAQAYREGERLIITGDDYRHICQVLRLDKGDKVIVCDGQGMDYCGIIRENDKQSVGLELVSAEKNGHEPLIKLSLFQGLPKATKMEWIIQKSVELGVFDVTPVEMTFCVAKVKADKEKKKNNRWQKIAEGAAKQSGRGVIPQVCLAVSFDQMVERLETYDKVFVLYEKAIDSIATKKALNQVKPGDKVAFIVGPEGGFADDEIMRLQNKANLITMGKRILRTETAGLAFLSVIMFLIEEESYGNEGTDCR